MITKQLTSYLLKLRRVTTVALVATCSLILPIVGSAEPEDYLYYRVKNVAFRPNFKLTETYNDNVFARPDTPLNIIRPDGSTTTLNKVGDFITSMSGGGAISLGRPVDSGGIGNYLELNYAYTHRFFHDYSIQNAGDHLAEFKADFRRPRIDFTPSTRFFRSRTILIGTSQTAALRDQLVTRDLINSSVPIRIQLTPKTFTTSQFNYLLSSFENGLPLLDTEQFSFSQSLAFKVNERYSLGVSGTYSEAMQSSSFPGLIPGPDQISYGGGLVAEGDFTDRLTGRVQFGLREVSFEGASDSITPPVVRVALDYQFARNLLTTINYTRSTFVGFQTTAATGVSDILALTIQKQFGFRKEWTLAATGNLNLQKWERSPALPLGRSDDWFTAGLAVSYKMRDWLTSSLSYGWQSFSSTPASLALADYKVNTVALSLRVGY